MSREYVSALRSGWWLWLVTLLLALTACDRSEVLPAPTQITLQIESDEAVRAALVQLRVSVALRQGADAWRKPTTASMSADQLLWPVAIPVTPRSEAEASSQFEVVVEALGTRGIVLAETRAIAAFERGRHKVLSLSLFRCPGHEQEPGYRCAMEGCQGEDCNVCNTSGECVPVRVFDPSELPPGPGDQPEAGTDEDAAVTPNDASAGLDATHSDAAASDATQPGLDGSAQDAQPENDSATGVDAGGADASPLDAGTPDASHDASVDAGSDAAVDAGNDASTACQANFKRCGATCIPMAGCCMDPECPTGSLCRQNTCKYWCDEQTRPLDVLAADYQCLDFEKGLPATSTWARSTTDTTKLSASSDRAFSLPLSLRTSNDAGTTWTTVGAQRMTSFSFSAQVNPIQHPTVLPEPLDVQLVCLTMGDIESGSLFEQCLHYTYKGDVDGIANYTGLFLRTFIVAGAALVQEAPLYDTTNTPLNFNTNVWNALTIAVGASFQVTVNGKTATASGGPGSNTKATISIGANDWTVSYDNVVVGLKRGP